MSDPRIVTLTVAQISNGFLAIPVPTESNHYLPTMDRAIYAKTQGELARAIASIFVVAAVEKGNAK
jgi:hypothetical protein